MRNLIIIKSKLNLALWAVHKLVNQMFLHLYYKFILFFMAKNYHYH